MCPDTSTHKEKSRLPIDGENNQGIDFSVVMSQVNDRCFSLEVAVKLTLQNLRRYPRDDLNVRHTAPEAVALSGLSYGGTDDSQVHVTIPIPSRISNLFVTSVRAYLLRFPYTCVTHRETTELYRRYSVWCQTHKYLT